VTLDDNNDQLAESVKYMMDHSSTLHIYHYEDENYEKQQEEKRRQEGWR